MSTSMADFETKLQVLMGQNLNGHLATLTQIKVTVQTVGLNLSLSLLAKHVLTVYSLEQEPYALRRCEPSGCRHT